MNRTSALRRCAQILLIGLLGTAVAACSASPRSESKGSTSKGSTSEGGGGSGDGAGSPDEDAVASRSRPDRGDSRRSRRGGDKDGRGARSPTMGDNREVDMSEFTSEDMRWFRGAWSQFLNRSPDWRETRGKWIKRGGAAPYLLAENLFRYFWAASFQGRSEEVDRVAVNAARVGEPAVAYFAKPLATDKVKLSKPIQVKEDDPNNPHRQRLRDVNFMTIDDTTRRDAAQVLATIGPPAVPALASPEILRDARPAARRYAAKALGHIATQDAVAALARMYRTSKTWQDRSAAVEALGVARTVSPEAEQVLQRARKDDDKFVRQQAEKALAGTSKSDF